MDPEMVLRPEIRAVRVWDKIPRRKIEETQDIGSEGQNNRERDDGFPMAFITWSGLQGRMQDTVGSFGKEHGQWFYKRKNWQWKVSGKGQSKGGRHPVNFCLENQWALSGLELLSNSRILKKDSPRHCIVTVFCSIFSKTKQKSLHLGNTYKDSVSQELFSRSAKNTLTFELCRLLPVNKNFRCPIELPGGACLKAIPGWTGHMGTFKSVRWQRKEECSEPRFLIYDKADGSAFSIIVLWTHLQLSVLVTDVSPAHREMSEWCLFLSIGKLC